MKYAPIEEVVRYFRKEGHLLNIIDDRAGVLEELISANHPETKLKKLREIQRIDLLLQGMYHYTAYGRKE